MTDDELRGFECDDCHRQFYTSSIEETATCPYCGSDDLVTNSARFRLTAGDSKQTNPTLPHAPSESCLRCGSEVETDRREVSLFDGATSAAFVSGNLCQDCFATVREVATGGER